MTLSAAARAAAVESKTRRIAAEKHGAEFRRSPGSAIRAKCASCIYDPAAGGSCAEQIESCGIYDCPLYSVRPIRAHHAPEVKARLRNPAAHPEFDPARWSLSQSELPPAHRAPREPGPGESPENTPQPPLFSS